MIDPLSTTILPAAAGGALSGRDTRSGATTTGGFDAALEAARKADSARKARTSEVDAIKSKGFSAWVRDTQIEKLKEKLRQQVMAEMGLNDDDLSKLSKVMQEILEKKIQEEVDKRLEQENAKMQDEQNGGKTAKGVAAQHNQQGQQAGKNDQDGKSCPVIPALSWPGAASLF